MTTTHATMADLIERELMVNGLGDDFDWKALADALHDRGLIVWTGRGYRLIRDDTGEVEGLWDLVASMDAP